MECRHSGMHRMQTFGYTWNADIRVFMESKHSGEYTDIFGYTSNVDIRVWTECRHSSIDGMQTFGYVWNANIRVSIQTYSGIRSSSDTRMLEIQQYKRKTHGFRTFSCFGPHIWNSLPQDLRHCSTLSSFKAKLKTFLFSQYFHPN